MTLTSLEYRLRRLERTRLPIEPMRALILQARPDEDVAPLVAEATADGTYRPNWPLVVLRAADWPAHREGRVGGMAASTPTSWSGASSAATSASPTASILTTTCARSRASSAS